MSQTKPRLRTLKDKVRDLRERGDNNVLREGEQTTDMGISPLGLSVSNKPKKNTTRPAGSVTVSTLALVVCETPVPQSEAT